MRFKGRKKREGERNGGAESLQLCFIVLEHIPAILLGVTISLRDRRANRIRRVLLENTEDHRLFCGYE